MIVLASSVEESVLLSSFFVSPVFVNTALTSTLLLGIVNENIPLLCFVRVISLSLASVTFISLSVYPSSAFVVSVTLLPDEIFDVLDLTVPLSLEPIVTSYAL